MKMARKFLISILIFSALIFAIGIMPVNARSASGISFNNLDEGGFWSKFRESVMKDKPNSDNEHTNAPRDEHEHGDRPHGSQPSRRR